MMVSVVIIGLQSFLSTMHQIRFVDQYNYNIVKIFLFVLMQLPAQFYQLFPMAGFVGALIGLTRLSSTSQLIVMRASGVSIARIACSVLKTAVIMVIVMTVLGEGVGSSLQQHATQMREKALSPQKQTSLLKSIWLHQGDNFTHIGQLKNPESMMHITRYRFTPNDRLVRATAAQSGQLMDNGRWKLSQLKQTVFLKDRVEVKIEKNAGLHAEFQPDLQIQMSLISAEQTLVDLYHTIQYRQLTGLGINQYLFSFYQRIMQPFATLVMICLAVPFVFGSFRSASMGMRMMAGIFIGFIFYMLNQLFGPITLVYQFPPLFAALIPTCVFLVITIILLMRTR